jgi:integrase/recombinase XerC
MEYSLSVFTPTAPPAIATPTTSSATPDVVALLLEDKRSADTRRAYAADLRDFFKGEATPFLVNAFLSQESAQINLALARYKGDLRARALAEATINRRLAAVKSLLKFAHRMGLCETDGRNAVDGERVKSYRDTRGVDVKTLKKLLAQPAKSHDSSTLVGMLHISRDTAILTLLIENALRRAELCKLNVSDFDASTRSLWILGKGRGNQKERVTLSPRCVAAIVAYLDANVETDAKTALQLNEPLFQSLDRRATYNGTRLTPDGLYALTGFYGAAIGLKRLTPHQVRHSSITAALDATKGDVRRVQKLSRHAKIETLLRYDDNREDLQGDVSGLLSRLV